MNAMSFTVDQAKVTIARKPCSSRCSTFDKLKVLASPTKVGEKCLSGHFSPKTIEIAKRFKFFNQSQCEDESATDFITELCALAKTCYFAAYLETVINQIPVGLKA